MPENVIRYVRDMLALPRRERHRAGVRTGNRDGLEVVLVRRRLLVIDLETLGELEHQGALVSARRDWVFARAAVT